MFAEEGLSSPWVIIIAGICAAFAAGVVKILDALSKYKEHQQMERRKTSKTNRIQSRHDKIVQARIKRDEERRVNSEYRALVQGLRDQVSHMDERLLNVVNDERKCQVKVARMEGEIRFLQSTVRRLQLQARDDAPGSRSEAVIMANHSGEIIKVNPPALIMFHYGDENELIGKNVEVLIPEDLRRRHRAGMARVMQAGEVPWEERTIETEGLTKDGRRLPISMILSAWRDDTVDGGFIFSAAIVRRYTAEQKALNQEGGAAIVKETPA